MIRGPDLLKSAVPDPDRLRQAPMPNAFKSVFDAITRTVKIKEPYKDPYTGKRPAFSTEIISGFEDLIGKEPIGAGRFYNTANTIKQLTFAISFDLHPDLTEILTSNKKIDSRTVVRKLRDAQVLKGKKIMDLGAGFPSFAVAAGALGAEIYTADAQDIDISNYSNVIAGHIVVDFNEKNADTKLRRATSGNFDLITENIIGGVPYQSVEVEDVEPATIERIAATLLKRGGYLYRPAYPLRSILRME